MAEKKSPEVETEEPEESETDKFLKMREE